MPDVVITLKTVDESSKTTKKVKENYEALVPGIEKAGRSVGDFVSKNAVLIGSLVAVGGAIKAAYGEYSKLAEQIRDLSLVSGTGAEEASRFIQVIDDYQLTAEDAVTASRFLKEKGLTPTIDTLAMLADKFKQIEDPAKRLEFVQENLGRGGAKWVNILSQESDALRDAAAATNEHLVMSDKQIAEYEQQRLALDALSDSWLAAKVAVGQYFGELILHNKENRRAIEILEEQGTGFNRTTVYTGQYAAALNQAKNEQEAQTQAMTDNSTAASDNEQAIEDLVAQQKELSDSLSSQIQLIDRLQSAENSYTEKSKDLANQRKEKEAELAKFRAQGYWEQSDQIQGALSDLEDIKQAEADLAKEREKQTLQFISNILAENLAREGWTEAEFQAFAEQQQAWGLWSADVVAKAKSAWKEADRVTASINAIPTSKTSNIYVNTISKYSGGTGSGYIPGNPNQHAEGGQFLIPMSYGNEGFRMGNGDTASGGETVSITPKGKSPQSGMDERKLARLFERAMVRALSRGGG